MMANPNPGFTKLWTTQDEVCWFCKKKGANVFITDGPDSMKWMHRDCYWKLQEILN